MYIHVYLSHILKGRIYMEDLKADDDSVAWIHMFRTAQWPLVCTRQPSGHSCAHDSPVATRVHAPI